MTEGERWAVAALIDLRRAGYRPGAWREFIRRSLERARQTRRARPSLAGQSRAWGAVGAAAWLATCRLARNGRGPSPSPMAGLAWWASVWQMLHWHLGMCEGVDGSPRERLSAADAVTLLRFWLVPLIPAVRATRYCLPAVILTGGGSDWLDGALARAGGETRLGGDLDTTADLAFLATAGVTLARTGRLPRLGAYALATRYLLGTTVEVVAVFGWARRAAVTARRWGAGLRVGGLALAAAGPRRAGAAMVAAGCLVPPRSTSVRAPAESRPACVGSHRQESSEQPE